MTLADNFDRWANRGYLTRFDLGIFRIVFAALAAIFMPNYSWISRFDDSFYQPPPGPLRLLGGFPPAWFFVTLDVLIPVFLIAVLLGIFTRTASVVFGVLVLVGEGFAFSFGKIDHSILFVVTPILMAAAGWGETYSLDARRRRQRAPREPRQWVLRLFALMIGVAFVTASLPKIRGGWLSPATQATYAFEVQRVERGRSEWLSIPLSSLHVPWLWELLDWATVIVEFGLIYCVLSWSAWKVGLSIVTLFHLGVLLTLNIDFWMNVIAYGAFVAWASFPAGHVRRVRDWVSRHLMPVVAGAVILVGLLALEPHLARPLTESLGWAVVMIGAAIAIGFLARLVVRFHTPQAKA